MIGGVEAAVGRFAARWTDAAQRRPLLTLAACLVLAVLALFHAARHLGVNADTDAMLSSELPFRRQQAQLETAFPGLEDTLALLVEASTPGRAARAADALAARLAAQPERFRHVFVPGGGAFFERNGLLYLELEDLEELADRLAAAQPFLAELSRDSSLASLLGLLERAVRESESESFTAVDLVGAFDGIAGVLDGDAATPPAFAWEAWALGSDLDVWSRRRLVLAQPVLEFATLQAAQPALQAIRAAVRELHAQEPGLRVRVTGDPALSAEELALVERQAGWAGIVAFGLVAGLLTLGLRSFRTVLALLATLACGLAWTLGFAALAVGHLNLISVAFAVLFIGLGVDFGIHFSMRYRELRAAGEGCPEALRASAGQVGGSLVLCALTTAIGFYAFVPTDYAGVAELGVIAGTAMFLSLAATLSLLPALLSLAPGAGRGTIPAGSLLVTWMPSLPLRRPRVVLGAALLAAAVAVAMLPQVRFDANPLHVRDPNAESVRAMQDLLDEGDTVPWTVELVAGDLAEAEALVRRLDRLEPVERAISLRDFVPQQQDEKLEVLRDVALFLGPIAPRARGRSDPEPARLALASLHQALASRRAEPDVPARLEASLRRLQDATSDARERLTRSADPAAEVQRLEALLLGDLPDWLARLDRALHATPVRLADLPEPLRRRYLAPDGRARVQVFPGEDASRPEVLERFVDAVQAEVPDAAGSAVSIVESARAIVRALRRALAGALVAITLLLLALWRSVRDTLLVLAPLLLAALLTAAGSVVLDLPFNFADVIVLPLLLGIGVDSGIHLVHRHRERVPTDRDVLHTSTARAVLFSAFTTIASFGSLAFSTHRGMASLGQLLTLGVALTLLANLLVLPALLTGLRRPPARSR